MSFDNMDETRALALAAAAAERVLPVFARTTGESIDALNDAIRLVWLAVGGITVSKQQFARSLNAVIAHTTHTGPAHHAARSVAATLEGALHNPAANAAALEEAIAAVRAACGDDAAQQEHAWHAWAASSGATARHAFHREDAPTPSWREELSAGDLPLFDRKQP